MASHTVSKYLEPPSQDSVREEFVQAVDVFEWQVRSSLHFPIPDDRTITLSLIGHLSTVLHLTNIMASLSIRVDKIHVQCKCYIQQGKSKVASIATMRRNDVS